MDTTNIHLKAIVTEISQKKKGVPSWSKLIRKYPKSKGKFFTKSEVLAYIKQHNIKIPERKFQLKPIRTLSGVAPVTIFTKPYPCSGHCIFCPNEKNMPKSYLSQEPGVQRAISQDYDAKRQIIHRIEALQNNLHDTSKIEVIISGGTWDDYPLDYRLDFIIGVFEGLNNSIENSELTIKDVLDATLKEYPSPRKDISSKIEDTYSPNVTYRKKTISSRIIPLSDTVLPNSLDFNEKLIYLTKLQEINETADARCIGLSIETRPDKVNFENIALYRKFGVTKVQIGVQTLDENLLKLNERGHGVSETYDAISLLRMNGFKIQIHWMCNLYGSTIKSDLTDFIKLFDDKRVRPDELKIYPCAITTNTKLYDLYKASKYKPYSTEELVNLLVKCKTVVPEYCRISRVIRDIPSNLIIAGNKKTNLRQLIAQRMHEEGLQCKCIRCSEIGRKFEETADGNRTAFDIELFEYETDVSTEVFIKATQKRFLLGFLRLSMRNNDLHENIFLIPYDAIIRELHVYGSVVPVGKRFGEASQHQGIGKKLVEKAEQIIKEKKLSTLAVISAVGTRGYYRKLGFRIEKDFGYGVKNL